MTFTFESEQRYIGLAELKPGEWYLSRGGVSLVLALQFGQYVEIATCTYPSHAYLKSAAEFEPRRTFKPVAVKIEVKE